MHSKPIRYYRVHFHHEIEAVRDVFVDFQDKRFEQRRQDLIGHVGRLQNGGSMRVAKQIVFRYNGDPSNEEVDLHKDGDKSVPKEGSFIDRKRARWEVTQVSVEERSRAIYCTTKVSFVECDRFVEAPVKFPVTVMV
jgi:hypothetical protein